MGVPPLDRFGPTAPRAPGHSRYLLRGTLAVAAVTAAVSVGCASPALAANPVLGVSDDAALVTNPAQPDRVLASASAHGARFVRSIAYMDRYAHDSRYLDLARQAAGQGLGMDVVLAVPHGDDQANVTPEQFASWAGRLARRLAAANPSLRLSVLNEPDFTLAESEACEPAVALRVVQRSGYSKVNVRVQVHVRRSRIGHRVVRRHGRRRVVHKKLVWKVHRWKTVQRLAKTSLSETPVITVRKGCQTIRRAQRAARLLRAAIPAIRAAAPGVEVGAGETSPCWSTELFMRELAKAGIPPIDRWAHHPYVLGYRGDEEPSRDGWMGSDRLVTVTQLVRELFGPGIPVDVTEFGVKHEEMPDPAVRVAIWKALYARACEAGIRSIVAYQWMPPLEADPGWNTAIMGPGFSETPESRLLPGLDC